MFHFQMGKETVGASSSHAFDLIELEQAEFIKIQLYQVKMCTHNSKTSPRLSVDKNNVTEQKNLASGLLNLFCLCHIAKPVLKTPLSWINKNMADSEKWFICLKIHRVTTVPLLGMYPGEIKSCVHTKIHTLMLIAPLFTTAKKWKQS